MESNTPARTEAGTFPPARIDAYGRLMVSVAELVAVANRYAVDRAARAAIEPRQ
jgi:hypothetical protein